MDPCISNQWRLSFGHGQVCVEILLNDGRSTLVDLDDAEMVLGRWRWRTHNEDDLHVVRIRHAKDRQWGEHLHRLIMKPPKEAVVDHINGDPLDNRRANLRICTPTQNSHNTKARKGAASRFKGVSILNRKWSLRKRWMAQIRENGITVTIGTFWTEEDAAVAYDKEAFRIFGEYARLNFPKEVAEERESRIDRRKLTTKGRWRSHCRKGHPLEGTNIVVDPKTGFRRCRACKVECLRRWMAKGTNREDVNRRRMVKWHARKKGIPETALVE